MKYTVLFCEDNKICFQGEDGVGIVNPADILTNGRIIRKETTKEIVNKKSYGFDFSYIHNVDIAFIPD
jgi:hypothetical protein